MQQISIIVAMNQQLVIGVNNQLPWYIPEDLAHFKKLTIGKPIIMGRKTFESIGRILPGRKNIIISRNAFSQAGAIIYTSLAQALLEHEQEPELCIIGGGEIFKQCLAIANTLYITWVEQEVSNPCAWFPNLNFAQWQLVDAKPLITNSGIRCSMNEYRRKIDG